VNTTCPRCYGEAKRETDTMDTFMCSSWYFMRYTSPGYDKGSFDPEKIRYWMPVDLYCGGAEHAVMHLLYSRFFTMACRDMGLLAFGEPYKKLRNQGIIISGKQRMSKSKGNVVTPDNMVAATGADSVRAYLMFIGPWDQGGEWNDAGLSGMSRWFNRLWKLVLDEYKTGTLNENKQRELKRFTHRNIKKVTQDIEKLHFNTMLAALMEFTNYLGKAREEGGVKEQEWQETVKTLLLLLAPSAPHIAEELWQRTGNEYSIHNQEWPSWDEELARKEQITLVVQVNGRLRDKIAASAEITEGEAKEKALTSKRVKPYIDGRSIIKTIYVPGKLVNIVVK